MRTSVSIESDGFLFLMMKNAIKENTILKSTIDATKFGVKTFKRNMGPLC